MKEASIILDEIKKAKSILLHCHPSPDPDSVGSALAMKFALEQLGKKVTVIRGDSEIPQAFMHFPGADTIEKKSFFEIDLSQFDLFIALDSGATGMSRVKEVVLPDSLKVINIDHHRTNPGFGSVNLILPAYPANCLILCDLFKQWAIQITPEIAANLFIGTYTDTGGFKYEGVTGDTFLKIGEIAGCIQDLPSLIAKMENSNTPGLLMFEAAALDRITFHYGKLAVSAVPFSVIEEKRIGLEEAKPGVISSIMRSVPQWKITIAAAETSPNVVKFSFRSSEATTYDVSRLAAELGGGGHKGAAGAVLQMSLEDAVKKVVETAKMLYNL